MWTWSFLSILDVSQHPSTLWVECQDKVWLDSPRNLPCSRDSRGARELWRSKVQFPPLPSHSNLRRCKFHVLWWWQIRGGPDLTTQLLLEGLRVGLIRLSCVAMAGSGLLKGAPWSCLSSSKTYGGTQSSLHCAPKGLTGGKLSVDFSVIVVCVHNKLLNQTLGS